MAKIVKCFNCGDTDDFNGKHLIPCSDGKRHKICVDCSNLLDENYFDLDAAYAVNRRDGKMQYRFEARLNDQFQTVISDETVLTLDELEYSHELNNFIGYLLGQGHTADNLIILAFISVDFEIDSDPTCKDQFLLSDHFTHHQRNIKQWLASGYIPESIDKEVQVLMEMAQVNAGKALMAHAQPGDSVTSASQVTVRPGLRPGKRSKHSRRKGHVAVQNLIRAKSTKGHKK